MKKYLIFLVALVLGCVYTSAADPFYKNIYADYTLSFGKDWLFMDGGPHQWGHTTQHTLGAGYRLSDRVNLGAKVLFDRSEFKNSSNELGIKTIVTVYGEYNYLRWKRLTLSAVAGASYLTFEQHNPKHLGEVGFNIGADFRIIRQVQLIVRYGFFGVGLGRDREGHYWDHRMYHGCFSTKYDRLIADFSLRRIQFGVRVNL